MTRPGYLSAHRGDRLTPVDRAAITLTALARGNALTAADVARLTGLRAAYVPGFMARLSLHAPVYCRAGRWRWCWPRDVLSGEES